MCVFTCARDENGVSFVVCVIVCGECFLVLSLSLSAPISLLSSLYPLSLSYLRAPQPSFSGEPVSIADCCRMASP
jgi:hypothetical protein